MSEPTQISYRPDPRFSYRSFVPKGSRAILVLVHGSDRDPALALNAFRDWAVQQRVALVAPLFPAYVDSSDDPDEYKLLNPGSVRYDQLVLEIAATAVEVVSPKPRRRHRRLDPITIRPTTTPWSRRPRRSPG